MYGQATCSMSMRMFVEGHPPGLLLVFYRLWDQIQSGMSVGVIQSQWGTLSWWCSRLLPVQVDTVWGRDFKFTIPDAPRCPTEGRLHLWIGGRKSEPAAAGAGQGLPPRKTQDSQDVQRPCTTHLRRYWGVRRREQRLLRGIHRARSILGAPPWLRVEIPPNSPLGGMWLQEKDVKCM